MAPGRWQRTDASVLWFAGALQETGNWDSYWNVTLDSATFSVSLSSSADGSAAKVAVSASTFSAGAAGVGDCGFI